MWYAPVLFVSKGHGLLRGCLWKRDSLLWGTANVLTPVCQRRNMANHFTKVGYSGGKKD